MKRCRERELLALGALKCGATLTQAAAAAGVSYLTLWRWKQRGLAPEAPERFRRFSDEVASVYQ